MPRSRNYTLLLLPAIAALTAMIIYNSHLSRSYSNKLHLAKSHLQVLNTEQKNLELEKNTLSHLVKDIAETRLQLRTPLPEQRVRVTP